METPDTRQRIVAAADKLFYQYGFAQCSFSQIAESVGISSGNFYHHFKCKDDILAAVIDQRQHNTRQMLAVWSGQSPSPKARILSFIRMFEQHQLPISRYGCPVGTLCAELTRLAHPHAAQARQLFDQMQQWLREQFIQLGRAEDANALALQLLASSQGVATLASTYQQPALLQAEVVRLTAWLDTCCPAPTES